MKSTYKLLGVEWDHAPLPDYLPEFEAIRSIPNYTAERNLFDLDVYERRVDATELLSTSNEERREIVEWLAPCDYVFLSINYEPTADLQDVELFFYLRIFQCICFLQNNMDGPVLKLMGTDNARRKCELLFPFIKNKTKSRNNGNTII